MTLTAISPLFAIKTLDSTERHSVSVVLDERTRAALAAETRFGEISWVDRTGSTNQDLLERAEAGAPEGTVIVADHQSAGRGRLDRTWEDRPGDGLLVSVLLRPAAAGAERAGLAPSAAALAAVRACQAVAGVTPAIKWPNDLLSAGGAKLAGILAVRSRTAVVVGMGLNVHGAPPGAAWLDTLAGRRVDRAAVLEAWLRELDRAVADWDAVADDYRRACSTLGRRVEVTLSGGATITATAVDVDRDGALVVGLADGSSRVLTAGDVTHLR